MRRAHGHRAKTPEGPPAAAGLSVVSTLSLVPARRGRFAPARGRPTGQRLSRPGGPARQCLRRRRNACLPRGARPLQRFSKRGRGVDASLTGNNEVERGGVETDRVEHVGRTGDELATERGEGGPEPTRRAGSRLVVKQHKLLPGPEAALELGDRGAVGALLRAEEPRRLEQRCAHVAGDERGNRQRVDDLEQAGTGVHRRRPAESEHEPARAVVEGCKERAHRSRGSTPPEARAASGRAAPPPRPRRPPYPREGRASAPAAALRRHRGRRPRATPRPARTRAPQPFPHPRRRPEARPRPRLPSASPLPVQRPPRRP